ncbi:MAG TPA: hypothetical protein VGK06_14435 [Methanosarcina sp.]|jgi:hypothetical protein
MKIKFLSLLLILSIIMISGCVNEESRVSTFKAPDLYKIIFFPYEPNPSPNPGPELNLKDATFLLDKNIDKAENISLRLKTGIESYKAEGKDVSRLEALLEKYDSLIKEAKQYRALANKAVAEENNSSIANSSQYNSSSENIKIDYLIQSQKSMMQADHVLRDIFEELRSLTPGSEELNNTSQLISAGKGKAMFMGGFTLNMHLEKGEIAIFGFSKDSEIDINGNYTFEEKNDSHNKVRLYHINSADVNISGSRKTVMLYSENVTLTADGEGYAAFQGNGTYSVKEAGKTVKEENWAKPFFEDGMSSEDYGPKGMDNNTGPGPNKNDMIQ